MQRDLSVEARGFAPEQSWPATRLVASLLLALAGACHDGHARSDGGRVGEGRPDAPEPEPLTDAATQPAERDAAPLAEPLDAQATAGDSAVARPPALPEGSLALGAELAKRDPDYLFDQQTVRTFKLWLSDSDLAALDADPAAEQYVTGSLGFEGALIADVGIRYKGSTGSFFGCVSGGFFPPSGPKSCVKLGMKIKIDHVDDDARFFRQKKLQFHAMNLDRSLLRERFGYALYNTLGVHAPRTAHVRLLVNNVFVGLFLLVEVIEGPFTRAHFVDGGKGNLYKEVWPVGNDEARYLAALESSGQDTPNASKLVAFAEALATADDTSLPALVEHWLDPDYMARFIAVDRALRHDDGPHHWYCGSVGGGPPASWHLQRMFAGLPCGNHNYFWYEDSQAERFWPIPWDLDNAMSSVPTFTSVVSKWDDLTVDCSAVLPGPLGTGQMPVTCDPLHRGLALSLRARVAELLTELAQGPLSDAAIDAQLAPWLAQIEPVVAEAHLAHPTEQDVASWQGQVQSLRSALIALREQALLDAQP